MGRGITGLSDTVLDWIIMGISFYNVVNGFIAVKSGQAAQSGEYGALALVVGASVVSFGLMIVAGRSIVTRKS